MIKDKFNMWILLAILGSSLILTAIFVWGLIKLILG